MEQLIAIIEKGQPFFNAIARNKYLKAIRDGFISVIPIIIFSSIFCLVASVPNIWGFYWPDDINNALWKCYNYSMGILAIACAATTAKHFADAQNRDLPKNNQINFISCMCAAIIGFLLLSSDTIATDAASGFNTTYLGSKGLLTAFIAAFVTGIIYKFFIKRNITVKMPEQVPPNISQTFKDIIPFSVCITVFWVFDIVFRAAFGFCFAQGVIQVFQPLFTAADGYIGLAVIYGAMSLFWFVGVHGPLDRRARHRRRSRCQHDRQPGCVPGRPARFRCPDPGCPVLRRLHGRHRRHARPGLYVLLPGQVSGDARRR